MKVGFLYNFMRVEQVSPSLELLKQAFIGAQIDDSVRLISFSDYARKDFFVGEAPDINKWFIYQETAESLDSISFNEAIFEVDLIIGFEISPALCQLYEKRKIPYLNFFIHPVRFLPDLLWQISTNDISIYNRLSDMQPVITGIEEAINQIKFKSAAYQQSLQNHFIHGKVAAIFGQSPRDSSIIVNKSYRNLYDYKEEIAALTSGCDDIIVVPHPCESDNIPLIKLIRYLGKGKICNFYSYALLADDRIGKVITLSSSIGIEAQYFNKEVNFLIGPALRAGGSMICKNDFILTFGQEILDTSFWNAVLNLKKERLIVANTTFSQMNLVRDLLFDWGYSRNYRIDFRSIYIIGDLTPQEEYFANIYCLNVFNELREILFFDRNFSVLYHISGFSTIENDGRWSDGLTASLDLPTPPNLLNGYIALVITPYLNDNVKFQTIHWKINNTETGVIEITEPGWHRYVFPFHSIDGIIHIDFAFSNAAKPEYDARNISIKIKSCEFLNEHEAKEDPVDSSLNDSLDEVHIELDETKRELDETKREIAAIKSTRSYRVMEKLRRIRDKLRV